MPAPVKRALPLARSAASPAALPPATPWDAHVREWGSCQRCELSGCRTETVLFRGHLPCQVLFVGEAPGRTEDALGQPFKGPAGHLLDRIVEGALDGLPPFDPPLRTGFTNLIACIPLEEDGDKTEAPPDDAVAACAPRLFDLVRMASPRLLVRVGKQAQDWLRPGFRHSVRVPFAGPVCDLYHPAWMLRKPDAFRDLEAHRAAVILRRAISDALLGGNSSAVDLSGRQDKGRPGESADDPDDPDDPDEVPF